MHQHRLRSTTRTKHHKKSSTSHQHHASLKIKSNKISRRHMASEAVDRSGLQPIASTPKTVSQLETLQSMRKTRSSQQMKKEIEKQEQRENARVEKRGDAPWWADKETWKERLNSIDLKQREELDQAANLKAPSQYLTRPSQSPYFIPLWDPELRTPELIDSFEKSSNFSIDEMDLIGKTLLGDTVNIRQRLIQRNKISLVFVVSTNEPLNFSTPAIDIWSNQLKDIQNNFGNIITEPTVLNISEGKIYNWFLSTINQRLYTQFSGVVADNIISLHINNENDAVSRARRFLDCRNRFVSNLFLVDGLGKIRWRSALAAEPSPEFMETLFTVTNDLITEIKYDSEVLPDSASDNEDAKK